ncbi:hypothetical protein [Bdellovibrio sp. HCB-162]|uniref:hypothetical protein n=1 Tax=Bdellovibrio sp. HCB-162 TaxID=3394234 RepID=UPI0039BD6AC9
MKQDSLAKFIKRIQKVWGPLSTEVVEQAQVILEDLTKASSSEPWLLELLNGFEGSRELYRDPVHGFILLAHTEKKDLYRVPHDHGNGWVIYAVQKGEMEMGIYASLPGENEEPKIVRREKYRVQAGESKIYLPGDIHDTKCISDFVLMFRLTSLDLKEELGAGRMRRF